MASNAAAEGYDRSAVPMGSTIVLVVSKGPTPTPSIGAAVPNTVGLPQAEALSALQEARLNAQVYTQASSAYERGEVSAQWPHAGKPAAAGSSAALLVSAGAPAEGTALTGVPNVVGRTEAEAQATLERVGLHPQVISEYSPTVPVGVVFGQLPDELAPAAAPKKTSPWLWVALAALAVVVIVGAILLFGGGGGGGTVAVPNVLGMTQPEAQTALDDEGLKVGTVTEEKSDTVEPGSVISQNPTAGTDVEAGSSVGLVVAAGAELVTVPDVVGSSKDAALQSLARAQLQVSVTETPSEFMPAGNVVSQSPKAGQQVPVDTQVGIVVSSGQEQKNVSVPSLVGLTEAAANQKLGEVGLTGESIDTHSATVPVGQVISQAPPAGASVAPGTQIAVLVSEGPDVSEGETIEVPNVVGKTLANATAILQDVGLKVTSLKSDGSGKPANEVLYQTPAAGDSAPLGSQVVVIVSSGS